jgi:hypothetical protein
MNTDCFIDTVVEIAEAHEKFLTTIAYDYFEFAKKCLMAVTENDIADKEVSAVNMTKPAGQEYYGNFTSYKEVENG